MADFLKLPSDGTFINLDHIYSIQPHSEEHVTLWSGGVPSEVNGDDARALLAKLQGQPSAGEPEQCKVYASANTDAAQKARELADSLSESRSRTFDFTDSQGKSRSGVVSKIYGGWVAEVDGQRYEGRSEAAAMSAAMSGVV